MPSQKKIEQVKDLTERLKESKSVVLVDYRGLTHQQLRDLRKKLKETGTSLMVTKNTLLKLALKNADYGLLTRDYQLEGPTAIFFIPDDPLSSLQVLDKFVKEFNLPKIKIGLLEGELALKEKILRLASLPSKEILTTQVVAYLKSPTQRLIFALNWNLRRLKTALEKIKEQKEN